MIRPFELGSAGPWPWRLAAYASAEPWLARVCSGAATSPWVLPLGGADPAEAADRVEALFRQASPAAELNRMLVWRWSEVGGGGEPGVALLAHWLDVAPQGLAALAAQIAEASAAGPMVAWIEVTADQLGAARAAARSALDALHSARDRPLVGIGLAVQGRAGQRLTADRAWPVDVAPAELDEAWGPYVHLRVAWHAGGDLERVAGISARRWPGRPNDAALSELLDETAQGWFAALPEALRLDLCEAEPADLPALLAPHDLLLDRSAGWWGPPLPAPWVARALLSTVTQHPARRQLRAAEACRPWSRQLLDRCLWLESLARDWLEPDPGADHGAATFIYEKFLRGDSAEARFIVDQRAANPFEEVDFASIGEAGYHARATQLGSLLKAIRLLRNVMAHGHPVGWAAHEALERLEDQAARLL